MGGSAGDSVSTIVNDTGCGQAECEPGSAVDSFEWNEQNFQIAEESMRDLGRQIAKRFNDEVWAPIEMEYRMRMARDGEVFLNTKTGECIDPERITAAPAVRVSEDGAPKTPTAG